jgi:hypothetical protein
MHVPLALALRVVRYAGHSVGPTTESGQELTESTRGETLMGAACGSSAAESDRDRGHARGVAADPIAEIEGWQ